MLDLVYRAGGWRQTLKEDGEVEVWERRGPRLLAVLSARLLYALVEHHLAGARLTALLGVALAHPPGVALEDSRPPTKALRVTDGRRLRGYNA